MLVEASGFSLTGSCDALLVDSGAEIRVGQSRGQFVYDLAYRGERDAVSPGELLECLVLEDAHGNLKLRIDYNTECCNSMKRL